MLLSRERFLFEQLQTLNCWKMVSSVYLVFLIFPVVDFIIKPVIEGQITVAKRHPCAYSRQKDIEDAMGGNPKDRKFIFFCNEDNFDSFRYDDKLAKDVKQYKMLVAWTAKRKRPDVTDLNVVG